LFDSLARLRRLANCAMLHGAGKVAARTLIKLERAELAENPVMFRTFARSHLLDTLVRPDQHRPRHR
jgi:hypothetical protein